jgi:glycine/sarcosine N-methyltransferase
MSFYSTFAAKYDRMLPWGSRRAKEERFFRRLFGQYGISSVLDCHCGTGFHAAMLTQMGYEVEGVDISPEMIAIARKNFEKRGIEVPIHECDIKELGKRIKKKFDCVISMGNSLPHEMSDDCLLKALRSMYEALNPGGICVIHMENFDALYHDRERFIPSRLNYTKDGVELFLFVIDYGKCRVRFNILSIIDEGDSPSFSVDIVEYNPLSVDKLKSLMSMAGFAEPAMYEDFKMTPLRNNTYDVIAVSGRR